MTTEQKAFEGWCIVEQMGHKTIAGFAREVQLAGVPMLRIDVPGPDGSDGEPVASQFIHASTIYALTPTSEAIVRRVADRTRVEPPATWGVAALPEPEPIDVDEDEDPAKIVDELLVEHGLAGVLEFIEQNYIDVPNPESGRYAAILRRARECVDEGIWPELGDAEVATAPGAKAEP